MKIAYYSTLVRIYGTKERRTKPLVPDNTVLVIYLLLTAHIHR